MTLQQTKDIILKWILSCETTEQLELLEEVISRFVYERFAGLVTVFDMDMVKVELNEALLNQHKKVVKFERHYFPGFHLSFSKLTPFIKD